MGSREHMPTVAFFLCVCVPSHLLRSVLLCISVLFPLKEHPRVRMSTTPYELLFVSTADAKEVKEATEEQKTRGSYTPSICDMARFRGKAAEQQEVVG